MGNIFLNIFSSFFFLLFWQISLLKIDRSICERTFYTFLLQFHKVCTLSKYIMEYGWIQSQNRFHLRDQNFIFNVWDDKIINFDYCLYGHVKCVY